MNCDDKPTKIISLDAEKLYFCPQTNVFVIKSKAIDGRQTVSFVDVEKRCYLATYNLCIQQFEFDPYGRYLAILDKTEKGRQLNIIDCVGSCLLVRQMDDCLDIQWRPEDKDFINLGLEQEDQVDSKADEYLQAYQDRESHLKAENEKKNAEKEAELVSAFNKAFNNPKDVEFGAKQKEKMIELVRTVYPEYEQEEMVEIDYKAIRKLNHT